jgi:hypothetical protein
MKYLLTLLSGMLLGASLFVAGMFFNPFADRQSVSPLSITDDEQLDFTYTAVPGQAILYTDNGESIIETHPDRVAELWEPAVVDTRIAVYVLNDSRGEVRGLRTNCTDQVPGSHQQHLAYLRSGPGNLARRSD